MPTPSLHTYCARITPLSALGTPLSGDTLFGQLCWALRNRYGETRLIGLLADYTQGQPFMVIANAYPAGYLPKPSLPAHWFQPATTTQKPLNPTTKRQKNSAGCPLSSTPSRWRSGRTIATAIRHWPVLYRTNTRKPTTP